MPFKKMLFGCIAFLLMLAGCGAGNDKQASSNENNDVEKKEIIIGLDPYDFSTVPAYLSKVILEEKGYDAKIQEGDVGILYAALVDEDIDVFIDIWAPNLQKSYLKKYEGEFDLIGTLYSNAPVGLAVPTFMDDVNTTEDLKKYTDEFKGTIYAIDAGSGMDETTRDLIKAYDLDYEVTNSSTPAMVAQADRMIDAKEPVVFNAWRPHTMFKMLDIKMLEDPKELWGSDKVQVGAVFDLKDKAPEAYTLYSNMAFTLDEIEEWQLKMEQEDKHPEELAKEWISENEERVNEWLEK